MLQLLKESISQFCNPPIIKALGGKYLGMWFILKGFKNLRAFFRNIISVGKMKISMKR